LLKLCLENLLCAGDLPFPSGDANDDYLLGLNGRRLLNSKHICDEMNEGLSEGLSAHGEKSKCKQ
jgi:hypothetical protein